jgi:hypothetical protein
MPTYYSQPLLRQDVAFADPVEGVDLSKMVKERANGTGNTVYEFIGSDDFNLEWFQRQRFEVDAGRLRVPLLYEPIYDIVIDPTLPETINIQNFGQGGFIFEEIKEGGEVKFAHVTSAEASVSQRQWGVALEYTKKMVMFNQQWSIARMERRVGEAYNALLNHLHFYPILNYTYAASNQTGANTSGDSVAEDWFLTLEDAIANSLNDQTNMRSGPYALLVNPSQMFTLERSTRPVPQQGFALQSTASDMIQAVIGYSGWTGTRGKKQVTYPGVPVGKGYLVSLGFREEDFASYVKQPLDSVMGNPDVSRFILEQTVWDVWLGIYANPLRAVEEITFPS